MQSGVERLAILADDFTGACDSAGAFAAARGTLVLLDPPERWPTTYARSVDVLSVDLDLRERSDSEAHARTHAAAVRVGSVRPSARLFLKIDSTLRGPIAGLIAGTLAGSGKALAVVAPAFPEQGRLLSQGTSLVDGQLGRSLMASLGESGTSVVSAGVARSTASLERAIESGRRQGLRQVVVDTDAAECLANLATLWIGHPDWLLVGSGGLARHVSRQTPGSDPGVHAGGGPILVVAGSPSPMTRAQIDQLRPLASVTVVQAGEPPPPMQRVTGELVVVCTAPANERDGGECARAVADTVLAWSARLRPGALILAGGATARVVCQSLGAVGVALSRELAPGVPIGHLVGGEWDTVMVVTKAGGFGTPSTLLDIVRVLVASQSGSSAEGSHE